MPKQIRGSAFNRLEVGSYYVTPHDRFVCCVVIGWGGPNDGVTTAQQAARATLDMARDAETRLMVYDRVTGEMLDFSVSDVEHFEPANDTE